ncbi:hypothetical protein ACO0QE_003885 [Hanseniaspora vineae]
MDHDTYLSNIALIRDGLVAVQDNLSNIIISIEYFQQFPDYLVKKLSSLRVFESEIWKIEQDGHLGKFTPDNTQQFYQPNQNLIIAAQLFHKLSVVIKYKKLIQYLPNDLELIPVLVEMISHYRDTPAGSSGLEQQEKWLLLNYLSHYLLLNIMNPFNLSQEINETILHTVISLDKNFAIACNSFLVATLLHRNPSLIHKYYLHLSYKMINQFLKVSERDFEQGLQLPEAVSKDWKYLIYAGNISSSAEHVDYLSLLKIVPRVAKYYFYFDQSYLKELLQWYITIFSGENELSGDILENTEHRFKLAKSFVLFLDTFEMQTVEQIYDYMIAPNGSDDLNTLHLKLLCIAAMIQNQSPDQNTRMDMNTLNVFPIISKYFDYQSLDYNNCLDAAYNKIRDAVNFITWAWIRSKNKVTSMQLVPYTKAVFLKLLFSTLFDYDLNIRRSALATLHELLGRFAVLDNVATVELMTFLNVINLQHIYSVVIPQIFDLFRKHGYGTYNMQLLERMILVNIGKLKKINITKQAVSVLLILYEKQEWNKHITEISNKFVLDGKNTTEYLYYLTSIKLLQPVCDIETCYNSFRTVSVTPCSSETSFRYLTLLKSLNFMLKSPTNKLLSEKDIDHVYNIFLYTNKIINKKPDYTEFYNELAISINIMADIKTSKYNSKSSYEHWQKLFVKLLSSNNNMLFQLLPLMDQIYKNSDILTDYLKKCNHLTKATLINALGDCFPRLVSCNPDAVKVLLLSLDDYTLTQEGDVGRKVRESGLNLIKKNIIYFQAKKSLITSKLLKLACEPIESLQKLSFSVLLQLYGEPTEEHISASFYERIIDFHLKYDSEHKSSFFNGYVATAGAIHCPDFQITDSLNAFLDYFLRLQDKNKLQVLNDLVRIFPTGETIKKYHPKANCNEINSPQKDLIKHTLTIFKFWERFLQNDIVLNYKTFNYKGFFARIFNIHFFCKNFGITEAWISLSAWLCCNILKQTDDSDFMNMIKAKITKA